MTRLFTWLGNKPWYISILLLILLFIPICFILMYKKSGLIIELTKERDILKENIEHSKSLRDIEFNDEEEKDIDIVIGDINTRINNIDSSIREIDDNSMIDRISNSNNWSDFE